MDTKLLVARVRELTHEYNNDPISDEYIVNRLNEAYRFVHNHYAKANDEIFGKLIDFSVSAGVMSYDLPEKLLNKRCDTMLIPTPPNESVAPWGYTKVKRLPYAQSYVYQTNRIRTYYPEAWSILNNKLYIFPSPLISYTAKLIVSRKIPPLGVYGGRITELRNNVIYLDELNDPAMGDNVGYNDKAYISVSDWDTGELKALFSYSAVSTANKTITLQTSPRKYAKLVIQDLTYTAVTAGTTVGEQINIKYVTSGVVDTAITHTISNYTIVFTIGKLVKASDLNTYINTTQVLTVGAIVSVAVTGTAATVQTAFATALYLVGGENKFHGEDISTLPGTQWGTIEVDDIVSVGLSTGVSIFGESLDTFLTDWAVMRLRGALNESDPETVNSLKLQLSELTGDLAGRTLGIKINMTERAFYGNKTFRR